MRFEKTWLFQRRRVMPAWKNCRRWIGRPSRPTKQSSASIMIFSMLVTPYRPGAMLKFISPWWTLQAKFLIVLDMNLFNELRFLLKKYRSKIFKQVFISDSIERVIKNQDELLQTLNFELLQTYEMLQEMVKVLNITQPMIRR